MDMDDHTTVSALRQAVVAFVDARDWRPFHNPKNLTMSIAIEAAELMECFQWLTPEEAHASLIDPARLSAVADELADVLIYCLSLSNALDLDISAAVMDKLRRNERRYPADEFRGRFRRPQRKSAEEE
jgi:NTP pyrophosphatase (non-canonical NTP hydrolase)